MPADDHPRTQEGGRVTTFTLRKASAARARADAVVIGLVQEGDGVKPAPGAEDVANGLGKRFPGTLRALGATGAPGQVVKLPAAGSVKATLVVAVGLGPADELDAEAVRRASGSAAGSLDNAASIVFALPADSDELIAAIVEGALLGDYAFTRYKSRSAHSAAAEVVIVTDLARSRTAKQAVATAETIGAAVNQARDWVNTPPADQTPAAFAAALADSAKRHRVGSKIMDGTALAKLGMAGHLAVGSGSVHPPHLVRLSYRPRRAKAHLALVGKGITFDSGGLSLKPRDDMFTMKLDMAGAAAVVAATNAIAALKLPITVTCYACLAENLPSGSALRPGDVLTMANDKTVEVLNTDAEGRLVLADGLILAGRDKPDLIVDVATLTGACVVGLGERTSGVMSNDPVLLREIPAVADSAGEAMWPLPITSELADKVKESKVADLAQHNPKPVGGALFAAAFLREFVAEGVSWAHLDIAGPSYNEGERYGYTPHGGTGAGVRTLVRLAADRANNAQS
jgi:leucyl aminopeptidase